MAIYIVDVIRNKICFAVCIICSYLNSIRQDRTKYFAVHTTVFVNNEQVHVVQLKPFFLKDNNYARCDTNDCNRIFNAYVNRQDSENK